IPGEPWAVVLLFDGFPLAKRLGRPGLALASSFVSSFVGALVATILFTFFALAIALQALQFGPAELFAVFVLSFATLIGLGAEARAFHELRERIVLGLSNSIFGVLFDVLRGHGATAAAFLGYGLARQYSKNKENFGKGEISGIMGPQSAADSAGVASLVPM